MSLNKHIYSIIDTHCREQTEDAGQETMPSDFLLIIPSFFFREGVMLETSSQDPDQGRIEFIVRRATQPTTFFGQLQTKPMIDESDRFAERFTIRKLGRRNRARRFD